MLVSFLFGLSQRVFFFETVAIYVFHMCLLRHPLRFVSAVRSCPPSFAAAAAGWRAFAARLRGGGEAAEMMTETADVR